MARDEGFAEWHRLTFESARCAAAKRLPGSFQQQPLLSIHGNSLWLRDAEEAVVKGLCMLYEAAKAFVQTCFIPACVHIPPVPAHLL